MNEFKLRILRNKKVFEKTKIDDGDNASGQSAF